jgi:hypothetical protein
VVVGAATLVGVVVGGGTDSPEANCGRWSLVMLAPGITGAVDAETALVTAPTPTQLTTVAAPVARIQAAAASVGARRTPAILACVQWMNANGEINRPRSSLSPCHRLV